jgi:hypothetical protein
MGSTLAIAPWQWHPVKIEFPGRTQDIHARAAFFYSIKKEGTPASFRLL